MAVDTRYTYIYFGRKGTMTTSFSGGFKEDFDLNDEDEEDEGDGGEMKTVNDHCILLIDARPNMFEPLNDDGDVRRRGEARESLAHFGSLSDCCRC